VVEEAGLGDFVRDWHGEPASSAGMKEACLKDVRMKDDIVDFLEKNIANVSDCEGSRELKKFTEAQWANVELQRKKACRLTDKKCTRGLVCWSLAMSCNRKEGLCECPKDTCWKDGKCV